MNRTGGRRDSAAPNARQEGYTLLLAMIMIIVMTLFGIFALNGSILQSRMAGNYQDGKLAFESAESGLRWGEAWLQSRTSAARPFPCESYVLSNCASLANSVLGPNMVPYNVETQNLADAGSAWQQVNLAYGADPLDRSDTGVDTLPGVASQPMLLMEQVFVDRDDLAGNPQQGRVFYRVHSAATGKRLSSVSVLESAVAKRFE